MIEFPVDGRNGAGYLAIPPGGKGPGVLLLHAWWGLTPFFKEACERFAREGFVTLAPDLYHGATAATIAEAEQVQATHDGDAAYEEIRAAVAYLHAHSAVEGDAIGVVGFSMGGYWALQLEDHIGAVVTFYGGGDPDNTASAAVQGHWAENDAYEPREDVLRLEQAMRASGRDVVFYTYPGTGHWFFEEDRPEYAADAARLAWQRTIEFLRGHIGQQ